jgi:Alpha-glutamyl/putrescinyl thymine pyrophosphorylase clade 3
VPSFCRHNRFIERCPICSKTLPGGSGSGRSSRTVPPGRASASPSGSKRRTASTGVAGRRRSGGEGVRVRREDRAEDDGYRSELLPGLRASADAHRLLAEISFSRGRLLALESAQPELYGEVRALAAHDPEQAAWTCLLIAYLCPLQGEDPFAGIRLALRRDRNAPVDLAQIPLGPRTCHDPERSSETLIAYRNWVRQAGSQQLAFVGDPSWSPQRRFERLFERLALPGFPRRGRYELLVTLGALGLYQLQAGSLHLSGARGLSFSDPATLAAKRVFAIGDPLLLDRRSAALAQAISVPIETLDLALANWGAGERATLGFPPGTEDRDTLQRARVVLGL